MTNAYYEKTSEILAAIVPANPNYKNTVGQTIYGFVVSLVGDGFAPKITGMLIDRPIEEIRNYLMNINLFLQRTE